jgi:hypothetical protein
LADRLRRTAGLRAIAAPPLKDAALAASVFGARYSPGSCEEQQGDPEEDSVVRIRRLIAGATAAIVIALGVGLSVTPAGASQSRNSCDGVFYTAYLSHGAAVYNPGQAFHACGG